MGGSLTGNAFTRTNLVFPLARHDFSVGSRDLKPSVQASLVMSIHHITSKRLSSSITTVVRALGCRESILGPSVNPSKLVQHGVLLLKTEPGFLLLVLLHDEGGVVAEVVGVGLAVRHVGFAHDEDVVAAAEGVGVDGAGAEVDVGVVAWGLGGGGAVKVPFGEIFDALGLLLEGLWIGLLVSS